MAHWVMARPFAVLDPDPRLPARRSGRRSCGSSRASRTPRSCRPASRAARPSVALSDDFRAGETSPIIVLANVDGSPTDEANVQRIIDLRAAIDGVDHIDRVEGPFAGLKDPATGARPRRRRDRGPVRHAARSAAAARSRPASTGSRRPTSAARPSGSTRSARSRRSRHRAPRSSRSVRDVAVDGVTTQVGGLAARATTSWPASPRRSPTPSR